MGAVDEEGGELRRSCRQLQGEVSPPFNDQGKLVKKGPSDEQIISILREARPAAHRLRPFASDTTDVPALAKHNRWHGVPSSHMRKELESESAKLKRLVAEQMLLIYRMKDFARNE